MKMNIDQLRRKLNSFLKLFLIVVFLVTSFAYSAVSNEVETNKLDRVEKDCPLSQHQVKFKLKDQG